MREYILGDNCLYNSETATKGTQVKYKKDNYFYKRDKAGNEGYVEYLVSRVLKFSTLPKDSYVMYEYCKVNSKGGCRSSNFLSDDEYFISMNTLFRRVSGLRDLSNTLGGKLTSLDRLNYLSEIIANLSNKDVCFDFINKYLKSVLFLDFLILNTDRHAHNYGIVFNYKSGEFKTAPIFDNGLSLDTEHRGINKCTSCTISGSFATQILAFGSKIESPFKLNYIGLYKDLSRIKSMYGDRHELRVLLNQLESYKSVFKA